MLGKLRLIILSTCTFCGNKKNKGSLKQFSSIQKHK